MKLTHLVFLLSFIPLCGFSQNLKKYSGEYPNEYGTKGVATYTYYEDPKTGNYVKHGQFKYVMKEGINYNATFSGNFKDGKRDGVWTYNITRLDDPGNNVFYTGSIQMMSNYKDGLPNGTWSYKEMMKVRGKLITIGGFKWTNYEVEPNVTATANFKNGIAIGNIKIMNGGGKYSTITGSFDSNGFLDKAWVLRSNREEIKMNFINGVQTLYVNRDFPNGRVYSSIIDDDEMTKLKNDYLTKKITTDDLAKKGITVRTVSAVGLNFYNFEFTFYNSLFNYKNIEGDNNYDEDKIIRNDGEYFLFEKKE